MKVFQFIVICIISLQCQTIKNKQTAGQHAEDWALTGFTKIDRLNPIMQPSSIPSFYCPVSKKTVHWEERNVLNPSAVVNDGKVYMIYRAQDNAMTSRLGLAISDDGLHFIKEPHPVLFPAEDEYKKYEWPGGVEDPRIVESEDGTYVLTYTSYDGKVARLCMATSKDLRNWKKHGPALKEAKYIDAWSKSGAIVSRLEGNKVVATKINGRYWMYFGDTDIFLASSNDLLNWQVAENEESKKIFSVLHPRTGYFDSRLVEPGPYALLRKEGILLIYNGSNAANFNDKSMPKFTYSAGQALFDKEQPHKQIARTKSYFIHPEKDYEKVGEVNEVCFVEGLVFFKNKWILYYGTADSKIAVAVRD